MKRTGRNQLAPPFALLAFFWEQFALGALCTLVLSAALSACTSSSSDFDDDKDSLRGARTVSFAKNGGDTEAVPESITLRPPATTVERLPEPPTRTGHTFAGWNTEQDGSGSPFTEQTPVTANILLIVYAQWDAHLDVQLSHDSITFTPMKDGAYDESLIHCTVTVSGFKNEADADRVTLEVGTTDGDNPSWFVRQQKGSFSGGTQTFALRFVYFKTGFDEAPTTLSIQPNNIPPGYEYNGGAHTLRVAAAHGQNKNRPIPVHQGNIGHFNHYANTPEGLGLYYQLTGNVELTPPPVGESNWTAIGKSAVAERFAGGFDGGGYSISGLVINSSSSYQGMFGYIREGAEIQNLGLEGGSISGLNVVGGLVGASSGGTVRNSYVTGSVQGGVNVGGLVGGGDGGTVHNSYVTGSVQGNTSVGGLVGANGGTVHNSYAAGSVTGSYNVGGLVGGNLGDGAVHNSVALNPRVAATTNNIGRVVGLNENEALLSGNYARKDMKLELNSRPYVPTVDTAQANKKDGANTSEFSTRGFWTSTLSSWDFSENGAWEWQEGFLPILRGVGGEQRPVVKEVP